MDGNCGRSHFGGPLGRSPTPTSSSSVPGPSSQSSASAPLHSSYLGAEHADDCTIQNLNAIPQKWATRAREADERPFNMSCKRKRNVASELPFVYILGMDNLYQPVRVDMKLLRYYGCRTQLSIDHNDPSYYMESDGVPVYHSWMTRSMLICFLKSLTVGKLCIDSSVSYLDACNMFDYEGITVPSAEEADEYAKLNHALDGQAMGVGMNKRQESLLDSMSRVAETIANAIMEWPRLEHGLESSFLEDPEGDHTVAFTCTPTRCWVRFLWPPKSLIEYGPDLTWTLCKRRPFWLASTLYALGSVHSKLVALSKVARDDRSETAFFALEEGIKRDPSYHFACTRVDIPRVWREKAKKTLGEAERFAIGVLNEVTTHGPIKGSDRLQCNIKYSRACIGLVLKLASNTPKIARMFSHGCEDDKGTTPERFALAKALKTHGIKVIKWGSDENALVFPPSFRGATAKPEGPCVLLGFENMR